MTTTHDRYDMTRGAALVERMLLLDNFWTAELSEAVSQEDAPPLMSAGNDLIELVGQLPEHLEPLRRWAIDEPDELASAINRALQVARDQLRMQGLVDDVGQLLGQSTWADVVLEALSIIEADAGEEIDVLHAKVTSLGEELQTAGDLRKRYLAALLIVGAALACAGPAVVLLPALVTPTMAALAACGDITIGLVIGLDALKNQPGPW